MVFIANLLSLYVIACFFLLLIFSLFDSEKKKRLTWQDDFYEDGKMSPAGYLKIQKNLGEKHHSQ